MGYNDTKSWQGYTDCSFTNYWKALDFKILQLYKQVCAPVNKI